jgi:hypothetical protein
VGDDVGLQTDSGREDSGRREENTRRVGREQDAKPYLRFSTADARGSDPGENTEAVGDADAVASTRLVSRT